MCSCNTIISDYNIQPCDSKTGGGRDVGLRERDVPVRAAGGRHHHRRQGARPRAGLPQYGEGDEDDDDNDDDDGDDVDDDQVHCDPGNLVLVLGCSDQEEAWVIRQMELQV